MRRRAVSATPWAPFSTQPAGFSTQPAGFSAQPAGFSAQPDRPCGSVPGFQGTDLVTAFSKCGREAARRTLGLPMVAGLAFVATAVATLFAQATAVRWSRSRAPHQGAWTIALVFFALASAALATGASTGWDRGTFRAFYLLGAIVNVPWLALGTVYLLMGRKAGDRLRVVLVMFTGIGLGVVLAAPMHGTIVANRIPVGKDV